MAKTHTHSFLYRNSLSIAAIVLMLFSLAGQFFTGWAEHNKENEEEGQATISLAEYATSGHFIQTTFENWESEFLQMGLFVLLTVSLRQVGSSESKQIEGKEEVDRDPKPGPKAPWPVNKGGIWLTLYKHSLSLAFLFLFLVSFILHFYGSLKDANEENFEKGLPLEPWQEYIGGSRFWFESFQNWQSEFLAVAAIVLLSIWLREKGSPQSKPVDAPHDETGE
jgi:cbb3-type cytochrome oxidase subunit 3